jgi:hypothetical protein
MNRAALLPGANVVATNGAVGARLERVTDESRRFSSPALAVGEYTLTVELSGFSRFVRSESAEADAIRREVAVLNNAVRSTPA